MKLAVAINLAATDSNLRSVVKYTNSGYVSRNDRKQSKYITVDKAVKNKPILAVAKNTDNGIELFINTGSKFDQLLSNKKINEDGTPTMIAGITYMLFETDSKSDEAGNILPVYTALVS